MEPITTDAQLTFEIRELYTIARNWQSNLAFTAHETALLRKHINTLIRSGMEGDRRQKALALLAGIRRITFGIAKVKDTLPAHLKMLEYLLSGAGSRYTLELIENHARLQQRNDAVFFLFLKVKAGLHLVNEPEPECV